MASAWRGGCMASAKRNSEKKKKNKENIEKAKKPKNQYGKMKISEKKIENNRRKANDSYLK